MTRQNVPNIGHWISMITCRVRLPYTWSAIQRRTELSCWRCICSAKELIAASRLHCAADLTPPCYFGFKTFGQHKTSRNRNAQFYPRNFTWVEWYFERLVVQRVYFPVRFLTYACTVWSLDLLCRLGNVQDCGSDGCSWVCCKTICVLRALVSSRCLIVLTAPSKKTQVKLQTKSQRWLTISDCANRVTCFCGCLAASVAVYLASMLLCYMHVV